MRWNWLGKWLPVWCVCVCMCVCVCVCVCVRACVNSCKYIIENVWNDTENGRIRQKSADSRERQRSATPSGPFPLTRPPTKPVIAGLGCLPGPDWNSTMQAHQTREGCWGLCSPWRSISGDGLADGIDKGFQPGPPCVPIPSTPASSASFSAFKEVISRWRPRPGILGTHFTSLVCVL